MPLFIVESFVEYIEMDIYFRYFLLFMLHFLKDNFAHQICDGMTSCTECVQTFGCGWCVQPNDDDEEPKCLTLDELNSICPEIHQQNPETLFETVENIPVSQGKQATIIQIQPQKVSLKMRVGATRTIEFKFKKAYDSPLDLYYLMDFSKSMHLYKNTLSDLADTLSILMQNLTSSFQLGFGTFVDKVALPFVNIAPDYINEPCDKCVRAYSFKNGMQLSSNTSMFSKMLKSEKMSGNMDTPEGGFDGLLQAMVCTKEINWRRNARKMIVLSTDAEFHIAGDGKLGGVVEPNDGKCHLNNHGEYTESLKYDYPSISLINSKAKEHSVNLIFAVTKQHFKIYTDLQNAIEGAAVGVLEKRESIINLVLEQYKKMSLTLNMTHNATASVAIDFMTKCPRENWSNKKSCTSLQGGDEVSFQIEVQVFDCSTPKQNIEIKPIGIAESLLIELEVLCDCECENASSKSFQVNSTKCTNHGNLTCGLCDCNPDYYGSQCECFKGRSSLIPYHSHCRKNNITCSGRGDCNCGICKCRQPTTKKKWRVSGKYCECDNFSCPSEEGSICSGHGVCNCGNCVCDPEWTGPSCSCLSNTFCQTENDVMCSGRGTCECGRCICDNIPNKGDLTYSGSFCEKCTTCAVDCTQEINDCIECQVHGTGVYSNQEKNCDHCSIIIANVTLLENSLEKTNFSETSTLCRPLENDENDCFFNYVAYFHENEIWVFADSKKTCPEEPNIIAIALGVTGGTVGLGIMVLLIWKIVTSIHDKIEYTKFEKERANNKWGRGDNPLYRKAVSTYLNPIFKDE